MTHEFEFYGFSFRHYVKKWEHSQNNFSGDSIQILLVDDFSNYQKAMESEGKIVSLSGVVRERPRDVEEDRIILNNRVQMEHRVPCTIPCRTV